MGLLARIQQLTPALVAPDVVAARSDGWIDPSSTGLARASCVGRRLLNRIPFEDEEISQEARKPGKRRRQPTPGFLGSWLKLSDEHSPDRACRFRRESGLVTRLLALMGADPPAGILVSPFGLRDA